MALIDDAFAVLGIAATAGGIIVVIAYQVFKRFGVSWLDVKFAERLASFQHEQQKELEQLRFQISALLDRATKLHQREFEVLPDAWAKLNDAYWQVTAFVSPLQQYPDLNSMPDMQFQEFVPGCDLKDWEKQELLAASKRERNEYYIGHVFWPRLRAAQSCLRESHIFLSKNGIFLPTVIKAMFDQVDGLLWEALTEHEWNERDKVVPRDRVKTQALREKGAQLLKELESMVQ